VRLRRAFGFGDTPTSIVPAPRRLPSTPTRTTSLAGLPGHPHRGIEPSPERPRRHRRARRQPPGNHWAPRRGRRAVDDPPGAASSTRRMPQRRHAWRMHGFSSGPPALLLKMQGAPLPGRQGADIPESPTTTLAFGTFVPVVCAELGLTLMCERQLLPPSRATSTIWVAARYGTEDPPCRHQPATPSLVFQAPAPPPTPRTADVRTEDLDGIALRTVKRPATAPSSSSTGDEVTVQEGEHGIRFLPSRKAPPGAGRLGRPMS